MRKRWRRVISGVENKKMKTCSEDPPFSHQHFSPSSTLLIFIPIVFSRRNMTKEIFFYSLFLIVFLSYGLIMWRVRF